MAKTAEKDFTAMLQNSKDMPKIQTVTDPETIRRYGARMLLAPPLAYGAVMRQVPPGKVLTAAEIRSWLARQYGADFTDPMTAGIFLQIAAFASEQRGTDPTPWWRVLKAGGELNPKYPGSAENQKALLEAEGHTIVSKGRKTIRYAVADFEKALFSLPEDALAIPLPPLPAKAKAPAAP